METIPDINKDFPGWYQFVTLKAELADYGPVKGTMIHRPYGYSIWKQFQTILDKMITDDGVEDAYFPLFIPYSYLTKEKEHVEGFSPEVAVVTKAGGEELEEPVVVRPTSETIMYKSFANWIHSYRDLPLKINQWANVVRWEKRTVLYLRTSEFLWQEGHTAHVSREEALEEMRKALLRYDNFYRTYLAIPTMRGTKTKDERFAGAEVTTSIEILLKSGKALQAATSHMLGQNFAKAFEIQFLDQNNTAQHVWQTSWGLSTRSLGGLIGVHGDEKGLVLPPMVAPIQVVIIPVHKATDDVIDLKRYVEGIEKMLNGVGIRYKTDWRDETPGWKFNNWELKGVPIRIEIGPKEVEKDELTVVTRISGQRAVLKKNPEVYKQIEELLSSIQAELFQKANAFLERSIVDIRNEKELAEAVTSDKYIYRLFFDDNSEKMKYLQDTYKITPRVIPDDRANDKGPDFLTGKEGVITLFAKAY